MGLAGKPNIVNESINGPTTWEGDGTVYVVTATIDISSTLTIKPGAVVKFEPFLSLVLQSGGTVQALGTAKEPIVFTSIKDDDYGGDTNADGGSSKPGPGDWGGVDTNGQNGSTFDDCVFLFGGNASANGGFVLGVTGGSNGTTVTDSTFANNAGSAPLAGIGALDASNAGSGTVIANDVFYENVTPLSIGTGTDIDGTNAFNDPAGKGAPNACQAIAVVPGFGIAGSVHWNESDVPFVLGQYLSIDAGGSLALGENVVVKSGPDVELDVDSGGTLSMDASDTFTSFKDDAIGGDSNCDGSGSQPLSGDWIGIYDYNPSFDSWVDGPNIFYAAH